MELRNKYKKKLAEQEERIFDFCIEFAINHNIVLDWNDPAGFTILYISQCERFYENIKLFPELKNNPNLVNMKDSDMDIEKRKYIQEVSYVEKVYSKDHFCYRCKEKKISIEKKQLRSLDEGFTTVYTCDACGWTRKEN